MATPRRYLHIVECLFYILVLALLLLWFDARGTQGENRMLATFPAWPQQLSSVRPFTQDVERWLSDRIGLRRLWLIPPRVLDVHVFGLSPSPLVTLGEDGTAYLQRHTPDAPAYDAIVRALGVDAPWDSVEKKHYAAQEHLAAWAAKARLPVLFLAIPTSPVFRFHQLPSALRQTLHPNLNNHPLLAAVQRFRADVPNAPARFLYPLETGREVAKNWAVYPQRNFHWTCSPFTTRVSEDILRALKRPLVRTTKDTDFRPCLTLSDITYLVGTPFVNWDAVCPSATFYEGTHITSPPLPDTLRTLLPQTEKILTYHYNEAAPQGTLLVVGDSFTPMLCLPLARNVREVICIEYGEATRSGVDTTALLKTLNSTYAPNALIIVSHDGFTHNPSSGMPGMEVFITD